MRLRPGSLPSWLSQRDRAGLNDTSSGTSALALAVAAPFPFMRSSGHIHESASGATTQPTPRPRRAFASLDGLRGLAILLVVWCHTDAALSNYVRTWPIEHVLGGAAATGVELFFVLSGFLLFLPFARAIIAGDHWPSVPRFYLRRALRILPGYYILIPVFFLCAGILQYDALLRHAGLVQALLGLTLLYDFQSEAYNLLTAFDGPLWTLTVEWQFYVLLPWLAYALTGLVSLFRRHTPQRDTWLWGLFAGLASLVVTGLVVRALGAYAHYTWGYPTSMQVHPWLRMLLVALYGIRGRYIEAFALGMLASAIYVTGIEQGRLPQRLRAPLGWSLCGLSVLGLAACIPWALVSGRLYGWEGWSNNFPPASAWLWSVSGDDAFSLCYMCLLLGTLLVPRASRVFSWAPLRFFGHISYSLYLWHMVGLILFFDLTRGAVDVVSVALILFFILIWSMAAYALVERPFLRLQSRFRSG